MVDLSVGFLPRPLVVQDRNIHSYEADFQAEQDLYFKAGALVDFLVEWAEAKTHKDMPFDSLIETLWIDLYERDIIDIEDVKNIQKWIQALKNVGYEIPEQRKLLFKKKKSACQFPKSYNDIGKEVCLEAPSRDPEICSNINSRKNFWTSDVHDGTRMDTPTVLSHLNQHVWLAGEKGKNIKHPGVLDTHEARNKS